MKTFFDPGASKLKHSDARLQRDCGKEFTLSLNFMAKTLLLLFCESNQIELNSNEKQKQKYFFVKFINENLPK